MIKILHCKALVCSEETFGHFFQMWYDLYKKPTLRENSLNSIKYVLNQYILPYIGVYRFLEPVGSGTGFTIAFPVWISKRWNRIKIYCVFSFKSHQNNFLKYPFPQNSIRL